MKRTVPFTVIYEDERLIAVNKASGVAVGGDRWDGNRDRLDLLLADSLGRGLYTVHRIDKDTSGIVLFAKDADTHRDLCLAFEQRQVRKRYVAVVHGRAFENMVCDLPLVPDGNKQHLTIIDKYRGKPSRTILRPTVRAGNYTALDVFPETGRTHQIRVHASAMGFPIICDALYCRNPKPVKLSSFKRGWRGDPADEKPLIARLALHAAEITLPDGTNLAAPLPRDMAALITQMERCARG
jgi:23S rRNA pseudouridine1911/1915/1917 synthase